MGKAKAGAVQTRHRQRPVGLAKRAIVLCCWLNFRVAASGSAPLTCDRPGQDQVCEEVVAATQELPAALELLQRGASNRFAENLGQQERQQRLGLGNQDVHNRESALEVGAEHGGAVEKDVAEVRSLGGEKPVDTPHYLFSCPGKTAMKTQCLTNVGYDQVVFEIGRTLAAVDDYCTPASCPQAEWAGCVLRLAGHDFLDFDGKSGGADGCTSLANPINAGLKECISAYNSGPSLQEVYSLFCTQISLADFLVIAAEAVLVVARSRRLQLAPSATKLDFHTQFRFGRSTAKSCASSNGLLPDPEDGCPAVQNTFLSKLGLDWEKTTALMAVHGLGRARVNQSGYDGWWNDPDDQTSFSNRYFVNMVVSSWTPRRSIGGNPKRNQWIRLDKGRKTKSHQMMLNTDLCLLHTSSGDKSVSAAADSCCAWLISSAVTSAITSVGWTFCGGLPSTQSSIGAAASEEHRLCCTSDSGELKRDCGDAVHPRGPAADSVIEFANDEAAWLAAFKAAWKQVTENGFRDLKPLQGSCPR